MEFLDGAPLAAFRAAAQPFRPAPAAFGTYKLRGRLCHIADNTDILGQSFSEILRGCWCGMMARSRFLDSSVSRI